MITSLNLGTNSKQQSLNESSSDFDAETIAKYQEALTRAQAGDEVSKSDVCHFVMKIARTLADQSEVLPESVCKEIAHDMRAAFLQQLNDINDLRGWLEVRYSRISTNVFQRRCRCSEVPMEMLDDLSGPAENSVEDLVISEIQFNHLIGNLVETQRTIVILRLIDDLPFAEIAVLLSRKEDSVRVEYHRALKKLEKLIFKNYGEGISNGFPASEPC